MNNDQDPDLVRGAIRRHRKCTSTQCDFMDFHECALVTEVLSLRAKVQDLDAQVADLKQDILNEHS